MAKHSHNFVEEHDGFIGFGLDRASDEDTVIYYLQKFSDDKVIRAMVTRMDEAELDEIFTLITRLLKNHFSDDEYHQLFLKEAHPPHHSS
jgi:peptide methionine sulfoxide reductase MsrA